MRLCSMALMLLMVTGCSAARHEESFRGLIPSDSMTGAARERELQWLIDHKVVHQGMKESDLVAKLGTDGGPIEEADGTHHYAYALGPGDQFHAWCRGGVVVEMRIGSEGN